MFPPWMGLLVPDFSFFAGLAYFSPDLCVSATSAAPPATTHPSIKEAALRAASTKGGGRLRRPPPFVDSFMDGCVVAVQVEDFGLPKSAVGTVGQTRKKMKF